MVCPNCGAVLKDFDAFCPGCGKIIQKNPDGTLTAAGSPESLGTGGSAAEKGCQAALSPGGSGNASSAGGCPCRGFV